MYLLDTNVVSELRRPRPNAAVLEWTEGIPAEQLLLPAVSIGEIQAGIEITRDQDPSKAEELETWLNQLMASYEILPMGADVFSVWARLMHRRSRVMIEDAMIAATAIVNDMTVVTRNVRDFRSLGIEPINPFED